MDIFLCAFFILLLLTIGTNFSRRWLRVSYTLTPNYLMTRWPVLFVTGRRSVFYFSKYWNIFPEFLAEHGYEVYTLHLPWSKQNSRLQSLRDFISDHQSKNRFYHLVVDGPTYREFASVWQENPSCFVSINEVTAGARKTSRLGLLTQASYTFHRAKCWPQKVADPQSLGLSRESSLQNANLLLQKIARRAEQDFQST